MDGKINEIVPSDKIVKLNIRNSGNTEAILWGEYSLQPTQELNLEADISSYLFVKGITVSFNEATVLSPDSLLTIIAMKETENEDQTTGSCPK